MTWLLDYYNYNVVANYIDVFARGVFWTMLISLICLVLSLLFGTVVAVMRMSSIGIIWRSAAAYIQFVRATPLLIQIYLVYYGLPAITPIGNLLGETETGILALTFHTTPYMAEIIRARIPVSVSPSRLPIGVIAGKP